MQNVAVCGIRNWRWKVPHSSPFCVVTLLGSKGINWVTIWQPNSFTNPPQFAIWPKLKFFILPRSAFISGRIALIFQNRFVTTTFFRNVVRICRISLNKGTLGTNRVNGYHRNWWTAIAGICIRGRSSSAWGYAEATPAGRVNSPRHNPLQSYKKSL